MEIVKLQTNHVMMSVGPIMSYLISLFPCLIDWSSLEKPANHD